MEANAMTGLSERIQKADWKKEKHVPVIECPDEVTAGEVFEVKVGLGKEIAHPKIALYFHPEGDKFTYDVGHFDFNAHGEAAAGPNQGPVYTHHAVTTWLKIDKAGTLHALAYCNIHGLWESSKDIRVD
jgi:superoxide reductase